jgi:two-component system cell cycle sensor histidine kinase/response regulator CckA
LHASAGIYTHIDGGHRRIPVGESKVGQIAAEGRPHISRDVQTDPRIADHAWARREGMTSFAGHPLLVGGQVVGVMALFGREPLSALVVNALTSIADGIAIRIRAEHAEQARLALEEQLRQSQKMDAVGRLAGGIAHDFNNLLSVILSYGELIMNDLRPDDPMRGDVSEIHKAGLRAAALTRQLLMFSRQQVIAPRVVDLNVLIEAMNKMLQRLVGADVSLKFVAATPLGRVRVDQNSIEQVIMNLVVNARDAMPKGGKLRVETANVVLDDEFVSVHFAAKPGAYVMLSVTDSGTGIDKATQARIFEPFFTTKPSGKGTGLGLSTVFGIVQQSGGHVWVESEPGKGTCFKVYLPRVEAAADDVPSQKPSAMARGTETVLLVEDEEQVRAVVRGILHRHGYTVIEASNGDDALLVSERHRGKIDLLLSDVVMPGMSGPDLAKRLSPTRPSMKVVCMSGYTDDAAVRHGVMDAAFAYLQKPASISSTAARGCPPSPGPPRDSSCRQKPITVDVLVTKLREVLDGVPVA